VGQEHGSVSRKDDSYVKRIIECDDENSWFIYSGASAHRPVIKNGMINIMRKLMAHTFT